MKAMKTYRFRNYYPEGHYQLPLKEGVYKFIIDHYDVCGLPNIGETGTEYLNYVKQYGILVKTIYKKVTVE
jgi:hypothetical protein